MSNIINLQSKFNEPTFIVVGEGKQLKVNKSYRTYMDVQAIMSDTKNTDNIEKIFKAIEKILGKEGRAVAENLDIRDLQVLFIGALAAVEDVPYEEVEARFQDDGEDAK